MQSETGGFKKGQGAKDTVGLGARRFGGDEVFLVRLCSHEHATTACGSPFVSAPPLIAGRGIVKNFEGSELARVSGAAAHARQGGGRGGAKLEKKGLACPYCHNLVFPLKGSDFSLPNWSYDELFEACCGGPFWNWYDDAERLLATGFVCLAGHIVLGLAGYPTVRGSPVPHSGEGLRLERSDAALYFTGHLTGKISSQEGQQFVHDLDPNDSISVGDRLVKLHERWPTEVHKDGSTRYRVFRKNPSERQKKALDAPGSIIKVLQSDLPYSLFQSVHKHILEGEPSLPDFMAMLLDAFKAQDDAWNRARRVQRALRKEGFVPGAFPHQESVDTFIRVSISSS